MSSQMNQKIESFTARMQQIDKQHRELVKDIADFIKHHESQLEKAQELMRQVQQTGEQE